jgi:hypothetical protein
MLRDAGSRVRLRPGTIRYDSAGATNAIPGPGLVGVLCLRTFRRHDRSLHCCHSHALSDHSCQRRAIPTVRQNLGGLQLLDKGLLHHWNAVLVCSLDDQTVISGTVQEIVGRTA